MGLTKCRVGDLITIVDERNNMCLRDFYGLNINKEFMPTVANTDNIDERKYKVVRNGRFVYSGMQTGRDECIRISMYNKEDPVIVSPAYTTFEVTNTKKVIPIYFFMSFLSKEKDRLGWFYSDSSVRSNLDWDRFCDIEIDLPPLSIQQKYVDIYNAMIENQRGYERGLDDLKLVADAVIESFKLTAKRIPIGSLVKEHDIRNEAVAIKNISGVSKEKQFMPSVASGADISKYKIVQKNQFACNLMHIGRDVAIPIALQNNDEPVIVSPAYLVFSICSADVLPEYLLLWMSRSETDRYAWFMSDTNVRSGMEKQRFYEIDIPIPDLEEQHSLVKVYKVLSLRKKINERIKFQIKDICPVLIKGSIEEASA